MSLGSTVTSVIIVEHRWHITLAVEESVSLLNRGHFAFEAPRFNFEILTVVNEPWREYFLTFLESVFQHVAHLLPLVKTFGAASQLGCCSVTFAVIYAVCVGTLTHKELLRSSLVQREHRGHETQYHPQNAQPQPCYHPHQSNLPRGKVHYIFHLIFPTPQLFFSSNKQPYSSVHEDDSGLALFWDLQSWIKPCYLVFD